MDSLSNNETEVDRLLENLVRITGELVYVYKNKHIGDRIHLSTIVKDVAELTYTHRPDLVPFAGGVDIASLLGKESSEAFAKRKWDEQLKHDESGRERKRGRNPISIRNYRPGSLRKRIAAKQARELPENTEMP